MKYVMYSFRSDHSKKAKVIVLFLLMVFSYIVTNCLSEASIAYDAPYNALEPYIMVLCNSYFRVFLHFALFLTICYHPNKSKCTTYMLYRCSRNRWLMGEKIYIAIYIVLYHACLISSLALFSWDASYISDRWSAFAIHASSLQNLTLSIPSGLTKYSLSNVFIRYLLMSVGYCLVISNIILALNYRFSNGVGVFAAVGIQLMDWLSDYFIEWFRLFADMKVFFYGNIVDIDTSVIIVAIVLVLLSDILIHRKGRSQAQKMRNMVEMHDVTITFKNNTVFQNVTYSLESNRIHGIVGRNGSGKSVLFRAICGLITPQRGHITVNGKIIGKEEEHPSSLGMIIETPAFLYSYSGFENLKVLAGIKGIANDKRIRECMECVELDPSSSKKVREYSLGMRQRLGIAQAIMEEPDLLILDEPMNSLDDHSVQVVSQLIREYKAGDATILLTSHHQSDIVNLCDSVHTIQNGSILPLL